MRKKNVNEELMNESWIYIFLLTTVLILMESLKTYTFEYQGITLSFTLFLLPFVYLISNYIMKKYGVKKCVLGISISSLSLVVFYAVMRYVVAGRVDFTNIAGEFCGYILSQLINLIIVNFLLNNTKSPTILIYLNYLFAIVLFYLFDTLISLQMIILDDFWITYFVTLGLQAIICLPIALIDKHVKRGLPKEK